MIWRRKVKEKVDESAEKGKKSKVAIKGGRNLVLLGVGATIIAVLTTGVSLVVYHNTGDIYLDRSRPGFLPDEEEIEEEGEKEEEDYDFAKNGELSAAGLEEYLEKLSAAAQAIDSYEKPFGADALSNERLGIPADEAAETGT